MPPLKKNVQLVSKINKWFQKISSSMLLIPSLKQCPWFEPSFLFISQPSFLHYFALLVNIRYHIFYIWVLP